MSVLSPARPLKIFLGYDFISAKDDALVKKFIKQASVLRKLQYPTSEWPDSSMSANSLNTRFVEDQLNTADLIILFVSPDFLDSARCQNLEMRTAFARYDAGQVQIIPVILRNCDWRFTRLGELTALPKDGRPIKPQTDHDKAFNEVVQGLRKILQEPSPQKSTSFTITSHHIPVCAPPYTYSDFFTDRERLLNDISMSFNSTRPHRTPILALSGPAGVGKTATALEYCYKPDTNYQNVLWFNASSRLMLSKYAGDFAREIHLPEAVLKHERLLFEATKQWFQNYSNWLLVLDQIEDLTLIDLLVPQMSDGRVLLTTRTHNMRKRATLLPVTPMDVRSGALFLLRRIQKIPARADLSSVPRNVIDSALAISHALKGHPLSLDQAGAYLEDHQGDLINYVQKYQNQPSHVSSGGKKSMNDHDESLIDTQALRMEQLQGTSALELAYLLAFLYPDEIPEALLAQGAQGLSESLRSQITDQQALDDLHRYALIRTNANGVSLQIQRGTQAAIIERLTEEQKRYWAEQAVLLVNRAFPEIRFDTRDLSDLYLPQAENCATLINTYHLTLKEGALLLERLGSFCDRSASYKEAETYLTQALHLYEQSLQTDVLDMAQTLNSLGKLARRQAQYIQAEQFHKRALKIRESTLGLDDSKTAESLHNLAAIQVDLGKYLEAEEIYLRVLSIDEKTVGPNDLSVADTLNNLGFIYTQRDRTIEAENMYHRALTIYKTALGDSHPALAYPLNGLAALAEKRGDYQQAEKLYQEALTIRETAFGEKHPEVAHSIRKLAGIAESQEDYPRAEDLYQRALVLSEQILGSNHPDIATILNNQGLLATKQHQYAKARTLYQRALNIYKLILGPNHPTVATIINNQGKLALLNGKPAQAERLFRRVLAMREKVLDPTHPALIQSLGNLANLLITQNKYEEAENLLRQASILYLQTPPPRPTNSTRVLEIYASLLEQLHRREEAKAVRHIIESR